MNDSHGSGVPMRFLGVPVPRRLRAEASELARRDTLAVRLVHRDRRGTFQSQLLFSRRIAT